MAELNETIHQPVRLRIMAALVTLEPGIEVDFSYLRDLLDVTDGNLGAHLRKLEETGYIAINKTFIERKPRTFIAASTARSRCGPNSLTSRATRRARAFGTNGGGAGSVVGDTTTTMMWIAGVSPLTVTDSLGCVGTDAVVVQVNDRFSVALGAPTVDHCTGGVSVVAFTPDDLQVVKGSPDGRRRFVDRAVFNRWPAYLKESRELPSESLVAGVPISLRAEGDTTMNNQVAGTLVDLGTQLSDPLQRLQTILAGTAAMKPRSSQTRVGISQAL